MPLSSRTSHDGKTSGALALRALAAIALGGVALLSAVVPATWKASKPGGGEQGGAPVRRGPMHIAVAASGNLKAADTVRMTSGVEGRTTILALAPEGTQVEKGQIVCELDASALAEQRIQQTITVGRAEASLVKATQA